MGADNGGVRVAAAKQSAHSKGVSSWQELASSGE
jgi:hypothetical protein